MPWRTTVLSTQVTGKSPAVATSTPCLLLTSDICAVMVLCPAACWQSLLGLSIISSSKCTLCPFQHSDILVTPTPTVFCFFASCPAAKPSIGTFLAEWKALYDSGSGERGLFSRAAAQKQAARSGRRHPTQAFGTNPCW